MTTERTAEELVRRIEEQIDNVERAYKKDLPGLLLRSHEEIGKIVADSYDTIRTALLQVVKNPDQQSDGGSH